jgi:hypothetical protein
LSRTLLTACAAALVLSACSKGQDPAAIKTDPALSEAPIDAGSAPASTAPSASEASADQTETSIPMAMRGRWGLVSADCTSDRGDAKGLLTIEAGSIRFYESVAKLAKVDQRSETALKASYAFSGEGMEWKRDMTLALQPGGKVLIKQEFGQDAPAGPYKYIRCG